VTYEHDAITERLPGRPRQQPAARHRSETAPADRPDTTRPDTTATPPAGEPSLAMLTSLATGPGMTPDDPLTSPTFSRPATDSRSYRTTRKSARPGDTANGAHIGGPPAAAHHGNGYGSNGYGNGHGGNGYGSNGRGGNGYPAADYGDVAHASNGGAHDHVQANGNYQLPRYDDPGHGYIPAAPAATATPPAGAPRPADRYGTPAHPRAQGNPYGSFVEDAPAARYPSIPPAGYQDQLPGADVPAYHGDHHRYQEPVYDAVAQMYPAPTAGAAARPATYPDDRGQFPPPAAYPAAGHPDDGGYGNGYAGESAYGYGYGNGNGGHPPGYPATGYAADQYGPDDYDDDYPVGQG
jgi:hypothetical protein